MTCSHCGGPHHDRRTCRTVRPRPALEPAVYTQADPRAAVLEAALREVDLTLRDALAVIESVLGVPEKG